jgi:hypothetical protein
MNAKARMNRQYSAHNRVRPCADGPLDIPDIGHDSEGAWYLSIAFNCKPSHGQ